MSFRLRFLQKHPSGAFILLIDIHKVHKLLNLLSIVTRFVFDLEVNFCLLL